MTLRSIRKNKKITESAMAHLVGMSRAGVLKVEKGHTTTTATLARFAEVLGITEREAFEAWQNSKLPEKKFTVSAITA